jgi:membrane protein implicated in regulation of membrane protease activity
MIWLSWPVWMIAALVLGFIEVLAPAFIFLGFAIGAALMGVALLVFGDALALSLPMALLLFAVLSLISWIVLRRVLGVREGQVKVWDKDIND